MHWIKHLRWPNLLLMAFLLYSVRHFLMAPILESFDLRFLLSEASFAFLVLSSLLIAAAGYLINDYYDQAADAINKPHRQLSHPDQALRWYGILNLTGIALAAWVGWQAGLLNLAILHIIIVFVLWKYAEQWKGIPLVGNLIIASLLAILVFVPLLFEYIALSVLYRESALSARYLLYTALAYATFAYLSNLVREIAKAAQDVGGDAAVGYRTLPVVYGLPLSRRLAVLLQLISLLLLCLVLLVQIRQQSWANAAFILLAVLLPGSLALVNLLQAKDPAGFGRAAGRLKLYMLGGVSSLAFFYIELMYL